MKIPWSKVSNLVISFALFWLVGMTLHEWGHYAMAAMLKVSGYVQYRNFLGGIFQPTTLLPSNAWLIYLAGGLFASILLFLIWLFGTKVGQPWDADDACATFVVSMCHLFYGVSEVILFTHPDVFPIVSSMAVCMGLGFGFWIYFEPLVEWWRKK